MCRAGARWVQNNILEAYPEADIKVYAVWFNVLANDHRSRWDPGLLPDPRVRHFWDDDWELGTWYAENGFFDHGMIAWDVYYLYGEDAVWESEPGPLLLSGYTIIGRKDQLRAAIAPYLED